MKNSLIIIAALESEINSNSLFHHIPIIYSGIGKINATLATVKAIAQFNPSLIINYGTAGKINPTISGLVKINRVLQRDMQAEPLAPRGTVPFSTKPNVYISNSLGHTCATGDSFVTQHDEWLIEHNVDLVDMELFAIAAVAHEYNLPWLSFKHISDDANQDSGKEWSNRVHLGEEAFWNELKAL
ncbi:MAG: 5'-methylthioadenosine nucleosidase [Betaproteobacteria bacterium]|jgi:adenosylhomocysteine nucleosidase